MLALTAEASPSPDELTPTARIRSAPTPSAAGGSNAVPRVQVNVRTVMAALSVTTGATAVPIRMYSFVTVSK